MNHSKNESTTLVPDTYYSPSERTLEKYCNTFGITFNRIIYVDYHPKIYFSAISSNSKPANILSSSDKSGFGCFSIFFTGKENSANIIWNKVNQKVFDFSNDREKNQDVVASKILTEEHLQILATWLKCKILVYCSGVWKKYGDWNTSGGVEEVPIFVLEKRKVENDTIYQIILSLED
uniref:TLDc domain-containing protein n=1 Tax=Panagrolaimus superbus TaxID=310955 RepID=A0A914YCI0_9BILA